jgi:hypothetical protein
MSLKGYSTLDVIGQQAVAQLVNAKQLVSQIPWDQNLQFAGKLIFYDSAIDGILKTEKDNPTVGMLICKSKKKTVVEYSLKDMNKPIGVSEYQITHSLPDELRSSLPTIEEIEAELEGM